MDYNEKIRDCLLFVILLIVIYKSLLDILIIWLHEHNLLINIQYEHIILKFECIL